MTAIQERVTSVYDGSDGALTKALYADLLAFGPAGIIAVDLFRAQKSSDRAKVYRGGIRGGGSYRDMAYERKQWALDNLCEALAQHADKLRIVWGWKPDEAVRFGDNASWVLYVYIPQIGQISFHSPAKGKGPLYRGTWDGKIGASMGRVIEFASRVLSREISGNAIPARTVRKRRVDPRQMQFEFLGVC